MGAACTKGVKSRAAVCPAPERKASHSPLHSGSPADYKSRRRGSVSAEPSGGRDSVVPRQSIGKALSSTQRIRELVRSTLMFKELDEEQEACIIDAMFERRVTAGEVVIREGEEADNFYVIESGTFAATKRKGTPADAGSGGCGEEVRVATYEGRGAFGELALMYNCPRAATVTALTDGVLWGVEGATFRPLVVCSMEERRQRYEAALRRMPLLHHLAAGQLAAVADCLAQEVFEAGQYIVREGAPLDEGAKFYMIESGEVDCFRTFEGRRKAVKRLQAGDVFGEVALLTKAPRQADCLAASRCKCLTLSRDAFERLMGPAEEVLSQQIAAYAQSNKEREAAGGEGHGPQDGSSVPPAAAAAPDACAAGCHAGPSQHELTGQGQCEQAAIREAAQEDTVEGDPGGQGAPGATPSSRPPTATAPLGIIPELPAAVPSHARPGSAVTAGTATLNPGSPAPLPHPSDGAATLQRRSASVQSVRSTAGSDGESACASAIAGGGGTPLLSLTRLQQQQQQMEGWTLGAKPASPCASEGTLRSEASRELSEHLPTIAEEPADRSALRQLAGKRLAAARDPAASWSGGGEGRQASPGAASRAGSSNGRRSAQGRASPA